MLLLLPNGLPPVAFAYQATPTPVVFLPKMVTVKVGNRLSLQTVVFGVKTLTVGQLQSGTVTETVSRQANESDWS